MEELINLIEANVLYAPYIIFGALILAGFNIPVSEDAMLFISAVLASQHPDVAAKLFVAVYLGAYFSDLISYALGRILGPKLFKIRFFANAVPPERIDKIHGFYSKYGMVTIFLGRFIPFGVRNGLFLTAGLGEMNFLKFALADLAACTITTTVYFSLYYHYGQTMIDYVKTGSWIILGIAVVLMGVYYLIRKRKSARFMSL
ncbi:MAG: DedA family protein [Methylobacter sp.]|nr:DedA family protein [Methylobacter sp.]MDP2097949.1 DedA family protein [Methylobacter sp.]MDP2429181.1 DedA family protein [Methylobacter sp.]MDP3053410.1 DedA family protein [Methylobacter sp.]MDP3362333.1 DedA family protein [Methylobacter sp.]